MRRWRLPRPLSAAAARELSPFGPLFSQVLYNRGLGTLGEARAFLAADERLLSDPLLMPDAPLAVDRVLGAVAANELIAVFADFDADGVTSAVLLSEGIRRLGGRATPYIPQRQSEGYGLNAPALERLRAEGATLVVTADCGVTGVGEVEVARELGLDVIVTDHHSPLPALPRALAVVDPKRSDSSYVFKELAGVGVVFRLLQAIFEAAGLEASAADDMLDLVALGTVADVVPLVSENRYLVKRGLALLNEARRPGVRELMAQAGLQPGHVGTEDIVFKLAPRLNAAGRLDQAQVSYDLLSSSGGERARKLAARAESWNRERQRLTAAAYEHARATVDAGEDDVLLFAADESYHPGVVGIVAGRLTDELYRPAVVACIGPDGCRGSARSIPEFDITAALQECAPLLTRFGGHARAAGFQAPAGNVPELEQRLRALAREQIGGLDLARELAIDAEVGLDSLGWDAYAQLQTLGPHGEGNPAPAFLSRRVRVQEARLVGGGGEHVRLKLHDGALTWPAIGFELGPRFREVDSHVDVVYRLGVDNWNRERLLELEVVDFAPAGS